MNAIVFGEMGEKSEDYCFLGSSIIPKIIFFNEWDKNAGAFTSLLFVIKTRQPLKQNFMRNCKKNYGKEKRIVISIAFCDFALWNFDSENFGLVFPKFSFFEAK